MIGDFDDILGEDPYPDPPKKEEQEDDRTVNQRIIEAYERVVRKQVDEMRKNSKINRGEVV